MKMDLSKCKKVGSDKDFTVLRHEKGHQIRVAHKALSKATRAEMDALPHFYDGGETEDGDIRDGVADIGTNIPAIQADQPIASIGGAAGIPVSGAVVAPEPSTATLPEDSQTESVGDAAAQTPQALVSPMMSPDASNIALGGINKRIEGIKNEADANAALSKEQARIYEAQHAEDQKAMADFQNEHAQFSQDFDHVIKEYNDGHVDPSRYYSSLSTAGKVSTLVGLVLGGLSSGMTGKDNPALTILNGMIDRDVRAQESEMHKKNNVLSAYMNKFQNLRQAADMTRLLHLNMFNAELAKAAAQTADPIQKARAQQMIGEIEAKEKAPLMFQSAARSMLLKGASGQAGGVNPGAAIRFLVPQHEQTAAYKELGEAQQMIRAKDNIVGAFDQLAKKNTIGNRLTSPVQTSREVAAIRDPLIAGLSKETAGRFTDSDAKMLGALFPEAGDNEATLKTKRNQLNKLVSEKMNFPLLETYGITPGLKSRFTESGEKRLQLGAPVLKGK